jgi:hypothetical protein
LHTGVDVSAEKWEKEGGRRGGGCIGDRGGGARRDWEEEAKIAEDEEDTKTQEGEEATGG